ncbi:MAG: response regulator [Alphaproteobacteria bacterium]|nr:response regulator [Alphaproteobacteria bacterium]
MESENKSNENFIARQATAIALCALTLLMFGGGFLLWEQAKSAGEARIWVDHTYEVRRHINLLLSTAKDAETGQRGYLLTGDTEYLEPYERALRDAKGTISSDPTLEGRRSLRQEIAILRTLTADNPTQQANLDEAEQDVAKLLDFWGATIKQRKGSATDADAAGLDMRHGKELMDELRNVGRLMLQEEAHLLKLRTELEDSAANWNGMLALFGSAFFYIALFVSILLYQRNQARAKQAALVYTRELERREEELKVQQEELKASNEEIEASNEELEEKTQALEEQNLRIKQQSKELEETKRLIEEKADELERASKYKSEFLANMSHELRTPLNSLLILARGLAANSEGNLTQEQIEEARVIYNGGLELLGLINDILDLSKVEAGKININSEDVHISGVVKRMSEQFNPVAKERGVAFNLRTDVNLPAAFHTDVQRLEQILKNLLSNAFKFTENGSVSLDIESASESVSLQRASLTAGPAIAFSVTDTGIGISESKLKDIFEAFQQEDGSIDRHYGGTGLGLTIARKFAHLLGGEIHVVSKKGVGSTFTLYLPLAGATEQENNKSDRAADIADGAKAPAAAPIKVFIADDRKAIGTDDKVLLIIEDDRDFATTLMKISRKRGYKCLAAGDGKSGLLLAAEQPVTAIILDLRLPDIDGISVLDQLKHNLKTRHIPVHIITGAADTDAATPLKKGAVGYLTKPVEIGDIDRAFSRIEGMLRSKVKHVLLIEDDKNTQTAVRNLLRQKNIEITQTSTGASALSELREHSFDCVILDLKLPDMTGFEWLEAVEKERGTDASPPIVIYTAKELTQEENRQLSKHTGSIVIKGASSSERLLDEVTLFLHSIESALTTDQRDIIRMQHNPDHALQNRTVLLVDDDMRNTFALSKLLKRHGVNVVIADNGQMALEKLAAERGIELVIMDIMMPVMDGYQAMREIRARKAWQKLPIIALTARAMPEEQERCMEAGANDYLVKPVDIERLLTLLRVWLFKQEKAA